MYRLLVVVVQLRKYLCNYLDFKLETIKMFDSIVAAMMSLLMVQEA